MDIESLKQQATTIRDEQFRSANTATRVGTAMLQTVEAVEECSTGIATNRATIVTNSAGIAANRTSIATNKANIEKLQAIYRGDMGNYASWTEALKKLDAMPTDMATYKNGQYLIRVGEVPFFVYFACLNSANLVFSQAITGSVRVNYDGSLQTVSDVAVNTLSRTYANKAWSAWVRLAAMSDVPTAQTDTNGTVGKYIYASDTDSTKYVLSGVGKAFQYGGTLKLRFKLWGSGNTSYDDGKCKTLDFPKVTSGADGVMDHTVYGRLRNNTIYSGVATTTNVRFNYTDLANGGNKTFSIAAATTAAAGVMTVAHVNALNSLTSHIVDLGDFSSESNALAKLLDLSVCAKKELVHAHLTYSTTPGGSTKNTLILIQSIEGNMCRQIIFNKMSVYHRSITFTDESRIQIATQEDFNFLFGDRLQWSKSGHQYVLSQFGTGFNHSISEPIPFADNSTDGLMSKEDHQLLYKIKAQLNL